MEPHSRTSARPDGLRPLEGLRPVEGLRPADGLADGLRAVNEPRPIQVEADDRSRPCRVAFPVDPAPVFRRARRQQRADRQSGARRMGPPHTVERIDEVWRVVDEWWRTTPVARNYYRVSLDDGRLVTLFHDEIVDGWFLQRY